MGLATMFESEKAREEPMYTISLEAIFFFFPSRSTGMLRWSRESHQAADTQLELGAAKVAGGHQGSQLAERGPQRENPTSPCGNSGEFLSRMPMLHSPRGKILEPWYCRAAEKWKFWDHVNHNSGERFRLGPSQNGLWLTT